jgi:hypothetical protein
MKPFSGGLEKSSKYGSPPLNRTCQNSHSGNVALLMDAENESSQKSVEAILKSIRRTLECASEKIFVLEEVLEILMKKRLNMKQFELLLKIEEYEGLLYYQLIDKLSEEQRLPKSTVRWNLNRLRSAKMIITGDKNNKGVPVQLTEKGKMVVLALKNGKRNKAHASDRPL